VSFESLYQTSISSMQKRAIVLLILCVVSGVISFRRASLPKRPASAKKRAVSDEKTGVSDSFHVQGNVHVDKNCVDCGACRWMCPTVFGRRGLQAGVRAQPSKDSEKQAAGAAVIACPVGAIKLREPDPTITKAVLDIFPAEIDPVHIPGVHHAGYHSAAASGATPYFVRRNGGNFMVDCPRYDDWYEANCGSFTSLRLPYLISVSCGGCLHCAPFHWQVGGHHRRRGWARLYDHHPPGYRRRSCAVEKTLSRPGSRYPRVRITPTCEPCDCLAEHHELALLLCSGLM
jgi:ferredoxin